MIILCGCAKNSAPTVIKVDSFCEGKFTSIAEKGLAKNDFNNITMIRQNEDYRITIDKFIDTLTINEREFKQCEIADSGNR